jgi:cell division protein FtsL
MVQVMSSPSADMRATPRRRTVDDQATFLSRWLKVWVILLTVVTLVVVGYLIVITNSLASINGNLGTAERAVVGAGQDVVTLPNQVDRINGALSGIDPALKPIPGQADQIIASLTSINSKLTNTDASLKDTSAILVTALGTANNISGLLIDANDPPDRLGVQNIHRRVAAINGVGGPRQGTANGGGTCGEFCTPNNLTTAQQDSRDISRVVNQGVVPHAKAICQGLSTLALVTGITGC